MKKIILNIASVLFLISSITTAQVSFNFSLDQEYHSNPIGFIDPQSSLVTNIIGGVSYGDSLFNIGYYGNYNHINSISERNSLQHQFGYWGHTDNSMWGGYIEQRINKLDYSYLDYTDFISFYRYQFEMGSINSLLSFNHNITDFKQYESLSNHLASGGIRLSKSFQSKTAVFLGSEINYKRYTKSVSISDSLGIHENNNNIFQINTSLRIAQSITENIGVAIVGAKRIILNSIKPIDESIKFAIGDDAEIFDSPISYNSNNFGLELTNVLTTNLILKSGYYYIEKDYKTQGIYLDEEIFTTQKLRKDFSNMFYLQLTYSLDTSSTLFTDLEISLNYQQVNNNSNSYWFNYKNKATSLSLSFNL